MSDADVRAPSPLRFHLSEHQVQVLEQDDPEMARWARESPDVEVMLNVKVEEH